MACHASVLFQNLPGIAAYTSNNVPTPDAYSASSGLIVREFDPVAPIRLIIFISLSNITPHFNFPPSTTYPPPRLTFPSEYASHRGKNINIAQNCETCCLLHGKLCLVMKLLILKQHSTSDACTMGEEELLVQFTEERYLITRGWERCPVSLR
jgi:hypothetical protein